MIKEKRFNKEITSYCIIAAISIMCVTLFCKSSPIYPICDLPDANTWLIQAKQVLSGLVLYKDIYEHKGPLQIFAYLFAFAAHSNNASFSSSNSFSEISS